MNFDVLRRKKIGPESLVGVRPVGEDNVDPKRLLGLVIAATQIQNHHKEEQYCIIKCLGRLAVENWKDQVG